MNIKVQLLNRESSKAYIESGHRGNRALTFHAFSDQMKARILESIAKSAKGTILIAPTTDIPRTGEWYEEVMPL